MSGYVISEIYPFDKRANREVDELLYQEGIQRDEHLDYTCGIYTSDNVLVATGSCFGNTLRCLAVSEGYQGEGLLNKIISHLITFQFHRGFSHLFVYTKVESASYLLDLGFYEIACVEDKLIFLENKKDGFSSYIKKLEKESKTTKNEKQASIVMNANPFTLGHLHLVEQASKENDVVHLFMVSEDSSLIPFEIRKKLIIEGTKHLSNVIYHDTDSYMISHATFPSYFLKDQEMVMEIQAKLDIEVFIKIAKALHIKKRYVGEEPFSQVTKIYNDIMVKSLKYQGIECTVIPRLKINDEMVSASKVRLAIKNNDFNQVKQWVPKTTYSYLVSDEAKTIVKKIQDTEEVIHH